MTTFRAHVAAAWLRFRFRMLYPRARYTEAGARFALAGTRPLNRALRRLNREFRRTARVMAAYGRALDGPPASERCFNVRLPL